MNRREAAKYVNTSLREIEEEDISREDDRESVRNARRKRATRLPNIFDPEKEGELETRKSEPFSWFKADREYHAKPVYPDVPSSYYEPDYKPPPQYQTKRSQLSSLTRVHTQSHKEYLSTQNLTPAEYSKNRRIIDADRLERNYASQNRARNTQAASKHLRNVRSNTGVRPVSNERGEHLRRIMKPLPKIYTITDEDADETSSANSREYMAEEPLTFGIFSPDEDLQADYNPFVNEDQMRELYLSIPAPIEHRREESCREFSYRLFRNNPLFRKLEYVTCVELICHCQIYALERGRALYQADNQMNASYIVLWGAIELYTSEDILQGSYQMGATLCEEYLLTGALKKIGQSARAGKKGAGVLELSHNSLMAIRQSLTKVFLKKDLVMLESIFRKNYFSKKSIRNSFSIRNGEMN